jgi:LCP family protein required for cell wall assembly
LLGFDEDVFNTDVMWVCQFDIGHGKLNILQIPRDCCLPDYTTSVTGKINSVYSMGREDVNPPIQRVVDAVQENFGIPIDAYITTVCYDIVDMVDLIGGIPIHIDNEIIYEADKIIPAGDVVLSGAQSEWFIRFRREWLTGDIGRMQNQRRFMAAAMSKLISIVADEGRMKLYSYMKEIYDNEYIYTDMSLEDISMLADFASTLSMDSVQVNMVPGEDAEYYAPDGHIYDVYSVHKEETLDMLNRYYRPYQCPMFDRDTAIVELVEYHNYTVYDDTSETLDELQNATEPKRDPNKAVK